MPNPRPLRRSPCLGRNVNRHFHNRLPNICRTFPFVAEFIFDTENSAANVLPTLAHALKLRREPVDR
jgi:hypothetical protein